MISGLAEDNLAHIISSPRILAINHEEAIIHIGQEIPYQTVSVVGGAAVSTVRFKRVGTVLRVVPHVTRDGMIRLEIEPEQSYVTDWRGNVPVIDYEKYDPGVNFLPVLEKCRMESLIFVGKPTAEDLEAAKDEEETKGPIRADFKTTVDDAEWWG